MANDFQPDIDAVAAIAAVPTILDVLCRTTGMGFAAVARVTEQRWILCDVKDDIGFGLVPGDELKVETTICREVRDSRAGVVIADVAASERYCGHPAPALYGFKSYISMPIVLPDGRFFGTLCAIDRASAKLDRSEVLDMFRLFAELIAQHLDTNRQVLSSQAELLDAHKAAELREMFIAVLGHDLRNPLAAVSSGLALLGRTPLNSRATQVVTMMQQSVVRMNELISNVVDFARGRLGGGIALQRNATDPLAPVLGQVIGELRATWPDREIAERIELSDPVDCDPDRIGQLFSNILSNALTYGLEGRPIRVQAGTASGNFVLSVTNDGPAIPPVVLSSLFEPFRRADASVNRQGLGLGLHIAREIARAHGGELSATSTPAETCFTLRMPTHLARAGAGPAPRLP